jgi:hypothetical protein
VGAYFKNRESQKMFKNGGSPELYSVRSPSHYAKHDHKTYLRQSKPSQNQNTNGLAGYTVKMQNFLKQDRSREIVSQIHQLDSEIYNIQSQLDTNLNQ